MARIALDADVLIAFLDAGDAQHDRAVPLIREHLLAGDDLLISASVYAEIIVRPIQSGTEAVVDQFLSSANIQVVPIDRPTAHLAAQLRGKHTSLRLPDALCLAAARRTDARLITFDERLARLAPHPS